MEYRQFPAPPDLAPWVECLWVLRGAMASEGQTILPDGRMELVFHFGTPPIRQPGALIAGQMTDDAREELSVLGARGYALVDRVWQAGEAFARAATLIEEAAVEAGRSALSELRP